MLVLHASELVWYVLAKKARHWVKEHIRKEVRSMVPSNPSVFAADIRCRASTTRLYRLGQVGLSSSSLTGDR